MSTCLNCEKQIPDAEPRLKFSGKVDWIAAHQQPEPASRALSGDAEFCCIRCLGTFIGVTLQSRGLIPPK